MDLRGSVREMERKRELDAEREKLRARKSER